MPLPNVLLRSVPVTQQVQIQGDYTAQIGAMWPPGQAKDFPPSKPACLPDSPQLAHNPLTDLSRIAPRPLPPSPKHCTSPVSAGFGQCKGGTQWAQWGWRYLQHCVDVTLCAGLCCHVNIMQTDFGNKITKITRLQQCLLAHTCLLFCYYNNNSRLCGLATLERFYSLQATTHISAFKQGHI